MAKLILVGTTLGNLEDISVRSLKAIFTAEILYAEDTRMIHKFKNLFSEKYPEVLDSIIGDNKNSDQKIFSYREEIHDREVTKILNFLSEGFDVYLTSDAGMPAISDPGFRVVRDVIEKGFEVDVIPTATALASALVVSGLSTDSFSFLGFLPKKKGKIIEKLKPYVELGSPVVLYESPYRVEKLLKILVDEYGEKLKISAANDLTKKFQSIERGSVVDLYQRIKGKSLKGEWVLILQNSSQ